LSEIITDHCKNIFKIKTKGQRDTDRKAIKIKIKCVDPAEMVINMNPWEYSGFNVKVADD
jgi:hypothetical protein